LLVSDTIFVSEMVWEVIKKKYLITEENKRGFLALFFSNYFYFVCYDLKTFFSSILPIATMAFQ